MCGRFYLDEIPPEYWGLMGVNNTPDVVFKNYNVTPASPIPIIHQEHGQRQMEPATWGLLPEWARKKEMKPMINARAETAASKPYFRGAFRHHRCLIPVSGFYEWQRKDDQKTPYAISLPNNDVMTLAGLYEVDIDNNLSCAILTIAANSEMSTIHSRMPVILDDKACHEWVESGSEDLLKSYVNEISYWPISSKVNSPRNNDAELLNRIN